MTESIRIRNYADTLFFSEIDHDTYCEYRLPGHGLMWVRSGRMEITSPSGTVSAAPGQFIFWQRDCASSMKKLSDGNTPFSSIAITLPREQLKTYFREHVTLGKLRGKLHPIGGTAVLLPETIRLESLFYSLLPYVERDIEPSESVINEKVAEAIGTLLSIDERFYPTLFDFYETWKIDLYEFMKAHFTEDMDIEAFAHYSGRSLATFKRDFAKISYLTPQRWLIEQRLAYAAQLISAGDKPGEAWPRAGFRNKAHFFKSFRNKYGCTPSEYYKNRHI